jgi:hypothetical protein
MIIYNKKLKLAKNGRVDFAVSEAVGSDLLMLVVPEIGNKHQDTKVHKGHTKLHEVFFKRRLREAFL